ncbi:MAG: KUP/HAK/KT family potassium transporter [Acidobacteria bacterium]|jgi:KUP system potassium uptake protein|nr:KUP/HAK/KT family potassium transporter [Acidobacteriota bacterium]
MKTENNHHQNLNKISFAGLLVALGIVFGDIGTSPLYTFSAIVGEREITETLALGALSAVFWTLTLQTTIKYITIVLSADNNGEGGVFSLYTLIYEKAGKWIMYPTIIGGSFILAEGIITPPISVSSAVEGLRIYAPNLPTVPIVLFILLLIFFAQQFGTQIIGKFFGPVMLLWFTFIGAIGLLSLATDFSILQALNPVWVYRFLVEYPGGFWLLGAVFLCTTGAEALYSDMGHVGRTNIRYSWIYVKICLILSYAGQTAFLMHHLGSKMEGATPFYSIVPRAILPLAIAIATAAAIIASQALISGAFTLIGEAIRLHFWYRQKIVYPTDFKGQLYIPQVNWLLFAGCVVVVLYFHESKYMEAAYGLSVTLTMMMTTILLSVYLRQKGFSKVASFLVPAFFFVIETAFLIANLIKFPQGGWITILGGLVLISIMWLWYQGRTLRRSLTVMEKTAPFFDTLQELSDDKTLPQYATHLVYLTGSETPDKLEQETMRSILEKTPKRADVYWFVHVKTDNEPFTMKYCVKTIAKEDVYHLTFTLGFRIETRLNYFFKLALKDMQASREVDITSRHPALEKYNIDGDIRFVLHSSFLSHENDLPFKQNFIMRSYYFLRRWFSIREDAAYGLDASNVEIEHEPIVVAVPQGMKLTRET